VQAEPLAPEDVLLPVHLPSLQFKLQQFESLEHEAFVPPQGLQIPFIQLPLEHWLLLVQAEPLDPAED
jgi:hypothetical protein